MAYLGLVVAKRVFSYHMFYPSSYSKLDNYFIKQYVKNNCSGLKY